jgi:hypothetical protein
MTRPPHPIPSQPPSAPPPSATPPSAPPATTLAQGDQLFTYITDLFSSFKKTFSGLREEVQKLDAEIEREHQELIIEMLAEYIGARLSDAHRRRYAHLLSETLLGFRAPSADPDLTAIFEAARQAILKVDVIYQTEGAGFEVCMRLFLSELDDAGKPNLKKVRLKRVVAYDELPSALREGTWKARATGEVLIIHLLSPLSPPPENPETPQTPETP